MTVWVLALNGFDLSHLLAAGQDAAHAVKKPFEALAYGNKYGKNPIDFISLGMALVLGTAGLPHVLMRFYTVPTAKEARKSVVWAIWLIGIFYLFTLVLGFGAMILVGPDVIAAAPGKDNSAAPLLAQALGGAVLMGIVSAIAFATILAVVAGLTITAATSFAHDIYASVIKRGEVSPNAEVKIAKRTVVVIGVLAIAGGIGVQGQNIAFLVALAFAVAASANLPTIIYSLYWRGFRTRGALWSMYGGLISSIFLIAISPVVSNVAPAAGATSTAMIKGVDFHLWDLSNPGIISIPLAFILGWLGSVLPGGKKENSWLGAEMEVRSLTGHGAEKEVHH
jgi:cation/acetate symporter